MYKVYVLYIEINTQFLKKFPSDKINGIKMPFFLSRAPIGAHRKSMLQPITVSLLTLFRMDLFGSAHGWGEGGFFHFRFRFVLKIIFLFKCMDSLNLKRHNLF